MNSSFCVLVGLLLAKLNHYFNDSIEKKKNVFWLLIVTLKISDTAPLKKVLLQIRTVHLQMVRRKKTEEEEQEQQQQQGKQEEEQQQEVKQTKCIEISHLLN